MNQEPLLMPNQDKPFNADNFVCQEVLKLRDKFHVDRVVELGSCVGGTTKWFGENFQKVYTIEINEVFREFCLKRIEGLSNIISFLGDTVQVLPGILEDCYDNTIIFVDSHWLHHCPLIEELEIIKRSGLKPVIFIHDFVVPNHPELGFDSYQNQDFTFDWIKGHIDTIYGEAGYEYHYNDAAEGAMRGVIYIYPKI